MQTHITKERLTLKRLYLLTVLIMPVLTSAAPAPGGGPPPGTPLPPGAGPVTADNCNTNLIATWISDMQFGSLVAGTGGTLDLASTSDTAIATGGVIAVTSTVFRGIIEVTSALGGCDIYPLTLTYGNTTLTQLGGGATMAIGAATFSNTPTAPTVDPTADVITTIFVGANLNVNAGQIADGYTGPISITVLH